MDKVTKMLLFVIGLGLWANASISWVRPAEAQSNSLASIAHDIHTLIVGGAYCSNKKICD